LASQVPPGSGLGLSGSVAVSMIKAIAFSCGLDLGPKEVAELACYIEIDKMDMPVGKQDQYASAFGGLNSITFDRHGVSVEPLRLPPQTRQRLVDGMMLFFLGASCQSSTILVRQRERLQKQDPDTMRRLGAAKELAMAMRVALESGDLDQFGELLHRSWMEKREIVPGISNPALDQCYQEALDHGALGGSLTGAGGGGFMSLFCPVERQPAVTDALAALGIQRWPCVLEDEGVQVMQSVPWSRQQALPTVPWTQSAVLQHTPFSAREPA
jgi:D-glycero-alpha-D-manno-heptose-7-phosphate kinase